MEALLFSFVGVALASWGDRAQLLAAGLSDRYQRTGAVVVGLLPALAAVCAVAAIGGAALHDLVGTRAQLLLVALGLAYAGLVGFFEPPPVKFAERFRGGPFLSALIFGFVAASGSRAQFLLIALAARADQPLLTAIGGGFGLIAATVPAALLGAQFTRLPLRVSRVTLSIGFIIAAFLVFVSARGA